MREKLGSSVSTLCEKSWGVEPENEARFLEHINIEAALTYVSYIASVLLCQVLVLQ